MLVKRTKGERERERREEWKNKEKCLKTTGREDLNGSFHSNRERFP